MHPLFIQLHPENLDNDAWFVTIVGYCVVVITLLLPVIIFNNLHRLQDWRAKQRQKNNPEVKEEKVEATPGDVNAAICTALYLYFTEMHDEEKYVMTVKKVSRTYSPWNSKIYGIMNTIKYW
jgi:hypothetical protein